MGPTLSLMSRPESLCVTDILCVISHFHNRDEYVLCEVLTEAEETIEHQVRWIVNIKYQSLRDFKDFYLCNFDED